MAHEADDLNTPMIAVVGFVSAIGTFILIIAIQVMYYKFESREERTKNEPEIGQKTAVNAAERHPAENALELVQYGWVKPTDGIYRMPIDEAKAKTVQRLAAEQAKEKDQVGPEQS